MPASIMEKPSLLKDVPGIAFVSCNQKFWAGMDIMVQLIGHEGTKGRVPTGVWTLAYPSPI